MEPVPEQLQSSRNIADTVKNERLCLTPGVFARACGLFILSVLLSFVDAHSAQKLT
jgi:hypothetical protein